MKAIRYGAIAFLAIKAIPLFVACPLAGALFLFLVIAAIA